MVLKYKTKGDGDVQGKQKVYFCCHEDDFDRLFDGIFKEITDIQDCAFCYRAKGEPITDELLFELAGVQLFVMPVTTKLLTTQNDALNVEFPFANKNKIPVLPLMQESGLVELFNDKCGKIQYLDKKQSRRYRHSVQRKARKIYYLDFGR